MTPADDTDILGQLADESDRAYSMFLAYRDQGKRRGMQKVADDFGVDVRVVTLMSRSFKWRQRIAVLEDTEYSKAIKDLAAERHASVSNYFVRGREIQELALALLKKARMTPSEMMRLLELGIKLEKTAMDEVRGPEVLSDYSGITSEPPRGKQTTQALALAPGKDGPLLTPEQRARKYAEVFYELEQTVRDYHEEDDEDEQSTAIDDVIDVTPHYRNGAHA